MYLSIMSIVTDSNLDFWLILYMHKLIFSNLFFQQPSSDEEQGEEEQEVEEEEQPESETEEQVKAVKKTPKKVK